MRRIFLSELIQWINSERELTGITRRIKKTFHEIQNSVVIALLNSRRSREVRWINTMTTIRRCRRRRSNLPVVLRWRG